MIKRYRQYRADGHDPFTAIILAPTFLQLLAVILGAEATLIGLKLLLGL